MRRCDADFIDPQLRRFVGMDVMHAGGEADNDAVVDRHREVMTLVVDELTSKRRLDRIVEDVVGNAVEYGAVAGTKHSVFERHRQIFARDSDWPYSRPRGIPAWRAGKQERRASCCGTGSSRDWHARTMRCRHARS